MAASKFSGRVPIVAAEYKTRGESGGRKEGRKENGVVQEKTREGWGETRT